MITMHEGKNLISCKLCHTELKKKDFRRDGSVLCPVCGQVYWKEAVEKALRESDNHDNPDEKHHK